MTKNPGNNSGSNSGSNSGKGYPDTNNDPLNDPLAALLQQHWHTPAHAEAKAQARLIARVQAMPAAPTPHLLSASKYWRWLGPSMALAAGLGTWLLFASVEPSRLSIDDPLLQASIGESVLGPSYSEEL
jgi:hypothetical protein